jgi:hypothetical protein
MRLPQKLSRIRIDREVALPCVTYEPAALKEWPTGWQIEYRVLNPDTLALEKRRIRFEKIRKRQNKTSGIRLHPDCAGHRLSCFWPEMHPIQSN